MSPNEAIVMFQGALWLAVTIAAPMLLFGLLAGLLVSVFQAVTQIQEMTLTFIPKILAVVLAMFLFLPWMINRLVTFTADHYGRIPNLH